MSKIVLAFSGGLDTTFCVLWLREQTGAEIVTVTVDTGGFAEGELEAIAARAASLGVTDHRVVDARADVFDRFVSYLIKSNGLRGGVYPVSVGAERTAQAEAVVRVARDVGATAIGHGSTRAGNDQIRFDVAIRALAPELAIHAPIRDLNWSRAQESAWLAERGIHIDAKTVDYSINVGLFGTTIGGKETHDSWQGLPEAAWAWTTTPSEAPAEGKALVIGFESGVPTTLDGVAMDPVALIAALNQLGGAHGIGRGVHVGDTILGIKGRVAFEAPAAAILLDAHRELEKLVLSRWQQHTKEHLASTYGMLLHEAAYLDPVMRDLEAFLESSQQAVSGEVRVHLCQGRLTIVGARSPYSMMSAAAGTYGEANTLWTGAEARGFAAITGTQARLARLAKLQGDAALAEKAGEKSALKAVAS